MAAAAGTEGLLSGSVVITPSTELTGALALRKFYVDFSAADLEDLVSSLDRAVALLRQELQR